MKWHCVIVEPSARGKMPPLIYKAHEDFVTDGPPADNDPDYELIVDLPTLKVYRATAPRQDLEIWVPA